MAPTMRTAFSVMTPKAAMMPAMAMNTAYFALNRAFVLAWLMTALQTSASFCGASHERSPASIVGTVSDCSTSISSERTPASISRRMTWSVIAGVSSAVISVFEPSNVGPTITTCRAPCTDCSRPPTSCARSCSTNTRICSMSNAPYSA